MNTMMPRIAAAVAAALVPWLLNLIGVEATAEERTNLIRFATDGINALGLGAALIVYPLVHRTISRFRNPTDAAKAPPEIA